MTKNNYKKKSATHTSKSFDTFPMIIDYIKKGSKLTIKNIEQLELLFGDRVKKALELVGANRVKKYIFNPSGIIRWVVNGHQNDYLILEHSFCSCKDFLFHAIMKKSIPSCYHLLAREIAERTDKYISIEINDSEYEIFMQELL